MSRQRLKENQGGKLVKINIQLPESMLLEIREVLETIDHTTISEFLRGKIRQRLQKESRKKTRNSKISQEP